MATIKPIIKSTLNPSSKPGNLKRKLEDIDPIDEIEEPKSMILPLFYIIHTVHCH
jgi:hypothetical protein